MSASSRTGTIRFGEFALDTRSGELFKDGRRIRLQEQPLKILLLLLDRPGELLTREELHQQLWPADTFVSFDDGLNTAIRKLRQALDDEADHPRFVETLPRRGYRFIAPVEHERPVAADRLPPQVAARAESPRVMRLIAAIATLAVIVIAAVLMARPGWIVPGDAPAAPIQSIAILPLENLSRDPSQEYFADGLTDELTTMLSKLPSLRVVAGSSVSRYKTGRAAAPEIGRGLGVDGVIEGSIARAGDRVRINVQFIEAATARDLFAESYDRKLEDILALQREVAEAVARRINIVLTPSAQASLGDVRRVDPGAYDDYLRGRFYIRRASESDNQEAIAMFERAVARDPNFALAYAELGRAYSNRGFRYAPRERQWQERAFVAVEKALALDPNLADAHLSRGVFLWTLPNHFPHEQAIREQRRALALNPNLAEAHQQLAAIYNHIGFLDEALAESRQAVALNPGNTAARNRIGESLLFEGKYEQTVSAFADVPQDGDLTIWRHHTVTALLHLGRTKDALGVIQDARRVAPADPGGLLASNEAMMAAAAGDARTAEEKIHEAIGRGKTFGHFHHTAYAIASVYALMHRPEPAMQWLEQAAKDGFPCYPLFLTDPNLDPLRRDPRFTTFMETLKARWEHYREALSF